MTTTPAAVLRVIGQTINEFHPVLEWDSYVYFKSAAGDVERVGQAYVDMMVRPYGDRLVSYDPLFNAIISSDVSSGLDVAPVATSIDIDDAPIAPLGLHLGPGTILFDLIPIPNGFVRVFVDPSAAYLTVVVSGLDGVATTGASYSLGTRPMIASVTEPRMSWVYLDGNLYGVVAWVDGDFWSWAWADVFGPIPLTNSGVFSSVPTRWSWRSSDPSPLYPDNQMPLLASKLLAYAPEVEQATLSFYVPDIVGNTSGLDIGPFYVYRESDGPRVYSASKNRVYLLNGAADTILSTLDAGLDVDTTIAGLVGAIDPTPGEYDEPRAFGFYLPGEAPPSAFWTRFKNTLEII